MLRSESPGVNHKRIYRLYSEANLAVRRRKKAKRPASERVPLQLAFDTCSTIAGIFGDSRVKDISARLRR